MSERLQTTNQTGIPNSVVSTPYLAQHAAKAQTLTSACHLFSILLKLTADLEPECYCGATQREISPAALHLILETSDDFGFSYLLSPIHLTFISPSPLRIRILYCRLLVDVSATSSSLSASLYDFNKYISSVHTSCVTTSSFCYLPSL